MIGQHTHTHTHSYTHDNHTTPPPSLTLRKAVASQTGESEDVASSDPRMAKMKAMFTKLAGDDGEIDGEELQDMLTASLSQDLSGSVFSLEACRSMISMLDVSYTL